MRKIRIFIEENGLYLGKEIKVQDSDFAYLTKVMRQKTGDQIFVFNGCEGEFMAEIFAIEKKSLILQIGEKTSELKLAPSVTLAFALVKNVRIDFVAAKATELGVSRFQPIITKNTIADRINLERFRANVKEACEQCERNDFPAILPLEKLEKFLSKNSDVANKIFILCDESGHGAKAGDILPRISAYDQEVIVLVGPEGGFAKEEFDQMRQLKNLHSISLGPRILRADTAIISALTLVQEFCGDFNCNYDL